MGPPPLTVNEIGGMGCLSHHAEKSYSVNFSQATRQLIVTSALRLALTDAPTVNSHAEGASRPFTNVATIAGANHKQLTFHHL
jgi:hypothetical protein